MPYGAVMTADIHRGEFTLSTDKSRLDIDCLHSFLSRSYWSQGLPRSVLEEAIAHSICFGLYLGSEQVGFARVITDRSTFAYLADVFIIPACRGKGLAKWLLQSIMKHEQLQGLRRFMLATRDAHALYRQFGFEPVLQPSRLMEILHPDPYGADPAAG